MAAHLQVLLVAVPGTRFCPEGQTAMRNQGQFVPRGCCKCLTYKRSLTRNDQCADSVVYVYVAVTLQRPSTDRQTNPVKLSRRPQPPPAVEASMYFFTLLQTFTQHEWRGNRETLDHRRLIAEGKEIVHRGTHRTSQGSELPLQYVDVTQTCLWLVQWSPKVPASTVPTCITAHVPAPHAQQ